MARYGKHGTAFGRLGSGALDASVSEDVQRIPAYSSAYSGANYAHVIVNKL